MLKKNEIAAHGRPVRALRRTVLTILCAAVLAAPLSAAAAATQSFTDSVGRVVILPAKLERIAPSGALAQTVLYSLVPDRIIGWSAKLPGTVKRYMPAKYWSLPIFGTFYGKNADLNMEALIAAKPDVVIDIGEAKKNEKEDLDRLQKQLGIPVVFVEATMFSFSKAYETLGTLLGVEKEAAALSNFCAQTVKDGQALAAAVPPSKRAKIYYGEGKTGLQTNPKGSIHADVIELIGAVNVADIPVTSGAGGNQISMEQLLLWNPDLIIFGPAGAYPAVPGDPMWKNLPAIKTGKIYEIPEGPYNWMGRPPATNRLIGVYWLGSIAYPDYAKWDLKAKAREFYKLFYHYDLNDAEYAELTKNSVH